MINKGFLLAITCLFLISTVPVNAALSTNDNKPPKEKLDPLTEERQARMNALKKRVAEIQAVDRSKLSKTERIQLRKELKDLKKAKRDGRGFVLALGGIVIVILLLVLLL